jgi:hypothetical protein
MAFNTARAPSLPIADQIKCRRCAATPRLLHKILIPRTGGHTHIYKCECGEQMWLDEPE